MKIFKKILVWLLPIAFAVISLLGCMLAERGAKEIGGYFEDNHVLSLTAKEDHIEIILFNTTYRIRR